MAKRRKSTKARKTRKRRTRDHRKYKIAGIISIFASFYLAAAFISYLFTWQEDQDKILQFSWQIFFQSDIPITNWLGRLGAIVSNGFFYWGLGVASFGVALLLFRYGVMVIRNRQFFQLTPVFHVYLAIILYAAVFLETVFVDSIFPWGGNIGAALSTWLSQFIGRLGLFTLLLLCVFVFVIWKFDPRLNALSEWFANLVRNRKMAFAAAENSEMIFTPEHPQIVDEEEADEQSTDSRGQLEFTLDKESAKNTSGAGPKKGEEQTNGIDTDLEISESQSHRKLSVEEENRSTEHYDPTLDLSKFKNPPADLLHDYQDKRIEIDRKELEANKDQIVATLSHYNIQITKIRATIGPTVTLYEIVPAPGVRISKIKNLEDDIALSLSALGIRIIAPIPGRGTIGIEVPNKKKQVVSLKEILVSERFSQAKMDLPIALGKTISNEVFVADLARMPHLLIAGATGQGKSVGINSILISLLYKKHPSQVKMVLIDPKKVELFPYEKLNHHFLATLPDEDEPIVTETSRVIYTLNSLCLEMDERYDLLKSGGSRNIKEYNKKFVQRKLNPEKGHRFLPYIILVIDEFADLIMTAGKEIELPIGRLAQLARAVGIHLIIATQRPSVNIITGIIKANFPARIAFKVTAKVDSRTILDLGGADQLIGRGDMLLSVGGELIRLQGAFVDTPEVERVIDYISEQRGFPEPFFLPEYNAEESLGNSDIKLSELDELFDEAARLVVQNQLGSTSMIQRRLKLGYNRAGRIMDQMEALGIVGQSEGSKPREVLVFSEMELDHMLSEMKNN